MTVQDNNKREDLAAGFLERFDNSAYSYDLSGYASVAVDTETSLLEDWQYSKTTAPSVEIVNEISVDSDSMRDFWANLDMPLYDIVERVFAKSLRPFVIIRDDKIEYVNKTLLQIMGLHSPKQMVGRTFLEFVVKDDWNLIAESIGQMLTDDYSLTIRMQRPDRKIENIRFHAVYIPDSEHFSFILFGEEEKTIDIHMQAPQEPIKVLFDDITALPSFYLFEDRVQMAVNMEIYKDTRLATDFVVVAGVSIENMPYFKKLNMEEFLLKKLSSRLVLGLKKNYTVARGLKCQFWVLFNGLATMNDVDVEMQKLISLLREPVEDNFTSHEIQYCVGASVFPNPARSAKQLLRQAVFALAKAKELKLSYYQYNSDDERNMLE